MPISNEPNYLVFEFKILCVFIVATESGEFNFHENCAISDIVTIKLLTRNI